MKLRDELIYRKEDAVIFDTVKGEMHELNDTARDIVDALLVSENIEMAVQTLQKKYTQNTYSEILEYINEVQEMLKVKGLLHE